MRAVAAMPACPSPRAIRAEEALHRAVVDLLEMAARKDIEWTHMPTGEVRTKAAAGKLKGMGTKAGWPDLQFVIRGRFHGLELKTATGRVSPAQQAAHDGLMRAGAVVAVARGLDEAMAVLREWGVIR